MSEPYQLLPKKAIKAWLAGLVRHGGALESFQVREGPTLHAIARHMGIPLDTLRALARRPSACMSDIRQRHFSKVIAMVENGQLVFDHPGRGTGKIKLGRIAEAPRVRARYAVSLGARGPALTLVDRPPALQRMPSFKDLLLK